MVFAGSKTQMVMLEWPAGVLKISGFLVSGEEMNAEDVMRERRGGDAVV